MTRERSVSKPSSHPHPSLEAHQSKSFLSEWEQLRGLVNQFSSRFGQVDELMQAIHSLSFAVKDKEKLKELISALAKLNQSQLKKTSPAKSNSGKTNNQSTPNLTGDSFYDLLNSPAMSEIVKEVMKKKKKRW
ncbi:hypothetical protein [Lihuaxuella thermophila]|uniref:Prion-inhibition and propagation HeLo domain-containing protein n=1 Tax=Lihuaxuella thermophila TaxID=1173111 RepID=A0A1H8ANZ6_9BACL|nr:hypothetical protein [Lihuaxuella thermophila]SEM72236.1 hypothetical protein SAMN05444955_101260 [Lihuaxuella thermophila]